MRRPLALMTAAITAGGLALMPAASSALAGATKPHGPGEKSPSKSKQIERTEVCFTVHVIGDPGEHQVSGTLFHPRKDAKGPRTALLLQHGSVSDRSYWVGGRPTVTGAPSTAEQLAAAGYDVFAIDRLGYGRSRYRDDLEGTGWALTIDSYIEMTHEMVTQIREGTYKVTDDACPGGVPPGRSVEKVFLVGHSSGSIITEAYATRHHDIDGIVAMAVSTFGTSDAFTSEWSQTVAPQWARGEDYISLFSVRADGYSQSCEDLLFLVGRASPEVIKQTCGPGYYGGAEPKLMPSGDWATQAATGQRIQRDIGNVGSTEALLVFVDRDAIFPTGFFLAEEEMWRTKCNCDVDVLWQKRAGHANTFHFSVTEATASIIEWLRTSEVPEPPTEGGATGPTTEPCPTTEQFPTLGLAGRHEDVAAPILPGGHPDFPPYLDESVARSTYRLDLSGSTEVPDATLATVRLALTWDDLSDFDLYVFDSAGRELGRSNVFTAQTGRGVETALLFETAHCTDLRVDIVNFAGVPTSNLDLDITVSELASG